MIICFALDKVKKQNHINKMKLSQQIGENSNVYMVNSKFSILYLVKAYVKMILTYMLDSFLATSYEELNQKLDSPSSYAAFILHCAKCCLNTGAPTS